MSQQLRGLRRIKAHKKENSGETSLQQRRKFIEVVSADLTARTFVTPAKSMFLGTVGRRVSGPTVGDECSNIAGKPTIRVKQMAMGHRTTRSASEQLYLPNCPSPAEHLQSGQPLSSVFAPRGTNMPAGRTEGAWGHCRGATEGRKKPNLVELSGWEEEGSWGRVETPIRKLLFDSACKENIFG